jgi:hypothetical protein
MYRTLIRVVEIHKQSVTVITANYAVIGTATLLEPLLGIITCSIPLLRPVLSRLRELLNLKPVTGLASDRSYRRDQYQHQPAWANIIETGLQRAHIRDQYPLDSIRLSDYGSKPGTKHFEASGIDSVSLEHILQHGDLSGRSLDKDGWV